MVSGARSRGHASTVDRSGAEARTRLSQNTAIHVCAQPRPHTRLLRRVTTASARRRHAHIVILESRLKLSAPATVRSDGFPRHQCEIVSSGDPDWLVASPFTGLLRLNPNTERCPYPIAAADFAVVSEHVSRWTREAGGRGSPQGTSRMRRVAPSSRRDPTWNQERPWSNFSERRCGAAMRGSDRYIPVEIHASWRSPRRGAKETPSASAARRATASWTMTWPMTSTHSILATSLPSGIRLRSPSIRSTSTSTRICDQ